MKISTGAPLDICDARTWDPEKENERFTFSFSSKYSFVFNRISEKLIAEIYKGPKLEDPFKRTVSRLEEMRSRDYLAKPHLP